MEKTENDRGYLKFTLNKSGLELITFNSDDGGWNCLDRDLDPNLMFFILGDVEDIVYELKGDAQMRIDFKKLKKKLKKITTQLKQ